MKLIQTIEDIQKNIVVLDAYLDKKSGEEYAFVLSLIKRGTCFIVVKAENEYRFYPSRFMGYQNNTMDKHLNNTEKDGKETNPAICRTLNKQLSFDLDMEAAYQNYCQKLGFRPNEKGAFGVTRKYWKLFESLDNQ